MLIYVIENFPFCEKSDEINFKIFNDYKETLKSIFYVQSSSKYLSFPNLKLRLGESYSMIGYHLPISIFQQLAIMQALKVPDIFEPCI